MSSLHATPHLIDVGGAACIMDEFPNVARQLFNLARYGTTFRSVPLVLAAPLTSVDIFMGYSEYISKLPAISPLTGCFPA
ncbi:MAG: hypothetical protein AAB344_03375 [Bacteroidota bacterium]